MKTDSAAAPSKTTEGLIFALMDLAGTLPWDRISVAGICRRARLHRSTFYAHFEDKDDLLARGLFCLFDQMVSQKQRSTTLPPLESHLVLMFDHVGDHRRFYQAVFGLARTRDLLGEYLVAHALGVGETDLAPLAVHAGAGAVLGALGWFLGSPSADSSQAAAELARFLRGSLG